MNSEKELRLYSQISEILHDHEYEKRRMVSRSQFVALSSVDKARLRFLDNEIDKLKKAIKEMER